MTVTTKSAPPTDPPRTRRLRWLLPAIGLILWLLVAGPIASLSGKTSEVQKNDNASYLPQSAESTTVLNLDKKFNSVEAAPGIVIFARDGGLTKADKDLITSQVKAAQEHFGSALANPPVGPIFSESDD